MNSKDIIKVENLSRGNKYIIRWSLTYICNYACDFCIQGNKSKHIEKSKGESVKIRTKICDNLIKFIETKLNGKYDYIEIYLIGGEVTILKDFLDIINKLVDAKFDGKIAIKITTNLSLSDDKLKELISIFNQKKENIRELHINASYYKHFAKEEEFINKIRLISKNNKMQKPTIKNFIYKKIKRLLKKYRNNKTFNKMKNKLERVFVSIGYPICDDNDYNEYVKFKKKYQSITPNIHFIIIKKYKTSISDKLKRKIVKKEKIEKNIKVTFNNNKIFYCTNNNKIPLMLDNEDSFNSKDYLCDVGMNNITISSTGLVSRCPSCKEKTAIGSMLDKDFDLPTEKLICPITSCNCSYYGVIEKQ